MWFSDASASVPRLSELLDREVIDMTPGGRLELQHKAVQLVRDITLGTSPKTVQIILRGVLADRPQFMKVGVICHQKRVTAIEQLGEPFGNRIVKTSYFGSGDERSSNEWYRLCDLIIAAGTPRVPPKAIRGYLCQRGEYEAANDKPRWGPMRWLGRTESGRELVVNGLGYRHAAWNQAHREIVRAKIVQAIGRGRGILPDGCEVVVLSNEECGLRLSDKPDVETINELEARILETIRELTEQNPLRLLGKGSVISPVSSVDIAERPNVSDRLIRKLLSNLESRGLIRRVGERRGWLPVYDASQNDAG